MERCSEFPSELFGAPIGVDPRMPSVEAPTFGPFVTSDKCESYGMTIDELLDDIDSTLADHRGRE